MLILHLNKLEVLRQVTRKQFRKEISLNSTKDKFYLLVWNFKKGSFMKGFCNNWVLVLIPLFLLSFNGYDNLFYENKFISFQTIDDKYQFRNDQYDPRIEGIKAQKSTNVSSDKIVLLSAVIQTNIKDVIPMPEIINLGIFTKNKTIASVSLSYEPKLYYVDPARKYWGPGFATFRWSTEIMQRHKIPLGRLYARAVFVKQGKRIMFPVYLYFQELPSEVHEYTFVVVPLRQMNLRYWILDYDTEEPVVTGTQQNIGENKKYPIIWDCRDENGNRIPEGNYLLKLQGTYRERLGRTRTVSVSYRFYHKNTLTK